MSGEFEQNPIRIYTKYGGVVSTVYCPEFDVSHTGDNWLVHSLCLKVARLLTEADLDRPVHLHGANGRLVTTYGPFSRLLDRYEYLREDQDHDGTVEMD
jgi:hypothetical protein